MYMHMHGIWCILHSFETCSGGLQGLYKCPFLFTFSAKIGERLGSVRDQAMSNVYLSCVTSHEAQ